MTIELAQERVAPASVAPTPGEAARVWLRIGLLGFGGPAGQIALMHRELVEERKWIGEHRFLHALNYCMLLPGPEAQQLAVYIGWLLHRTVGGLIAGALFVLPGALVMLGLSILYTSYRHLPFVDVVFFGIKAAVIAIVVEAVVRIGKRALKNRMMLAIAAGAFIGIYIFAIPFPLIVLLAGLLGVIGGRLTPWMFGGAKASDGGESPDESNVIDRMFAAGELSHAAPSSAFAMRVLLIGGVLWLGPLLLLWLLTGGGSVWTQIGSFFSGMALVTFGGAYAVLAYVAQAAVDTFGWLRPGEMADGLGLAETTPGPLVLVLQFVGYLASFRAPGALNPVLAGSLGALLTTWMTFAPCFIWIFLGGPYVEKLRNNQAARSALSAITAAVVGVVANLALWFALHVLFRSTTGLKLPWGEIDIPVWGALDWRAAVIAVAAMVAMLRFKVGMISVLAASGLSACLLMLI
ncbi:chromate transporter [Camelimonas fluminis]|uniref:Chromate efflux transporter n=1 Tax=Camelimonas fluminis TaxID=1576911 RepID=A0ABV7UBU4_9HYPH|nr:chromate efflux transporter [Camelimonas fluminis]GHE73555.1 chromate transporter [Camelimonas fluminis]